jgi:hypothetical protein
MPQQAVPSLTDRSKTCCDRAPVRFNIRLPPHPGELLSVTTWLSFRGATCPEPLGFGQTVVVWHMGLQVVLRPGIPWHRHAETGSKRAFISSRSGFHDSSPEPPVIALAVVSNTFVRAKQPATTAVPKSAGNLIG